MKGLSEMVMLITKIIIAGMFLYGITMLMFNTVVTSHVSADENQLRILKDRVNNLCAQLEDLPNQRKIEEPVKTINDFRLTSSMKFFQLLNKTTLKENGNEEEVEGALIYAEWKWNNRKYLIKAENCDQWGKIIFNDKPVEGKFRITGKTNKGEVKFNRGAIYEVEIKGEISNGKRIVDIAFTEKEKSV